MVQFYATVVSLKAVDQKPQVSTIIYLITFLGSMDYVYYTTIQIVNGLTLYTNFIINILFLGKDADSQAS